MNESWSRYNNTLLQPVTYLLVLGTQHIQMSVFVVRLYPITYLQIDQLQKKAHCGNEKHQGKLEDHKKNLIRHSTQERKPGKEKRESYRKRTKIYCLSAIQKFNFRSVYKSTYTLTTQNQWNEINTHQTYSKKQVYIIYNTKGESTVSKLQLHQDKYFIFFFFFFKQMPCFTPLEKMSVKASRHFSYT